MTARQFPFDHSGRLVVSSAFAVVVRRCLNASIRPDSLIPSRIASLISRYVSHRQMAVTSIETANKKIACLAISTSSVCKFIARRSLVVVAHFASAVWAWA
jgi:hypothetical protein